MSFESEYLIRYNRKADISHNKKIYLCRPNKDVLCLLNGVEIDSVSYTANLKSYDELSFTIDRYINVYDHALGINKLMESNGYEDIGVYHLLYLEDIGYFQIQEPTVSFDGEKEVKSVTAYSNEKEFEDKDLVDFAVNTGEEGSMERLAESNQASIADTGFPLNYVIFYNVDDPELSLLDLVLEKMPGWSVGHVDMVLNNTRFQFETTSQNIYAFLTSTVAPYCRCIFTFDTINNLVNAYSVETFGEDTNVFIGVRNLINQVDVSANEDGVYTRFNVRGADNLTVSNVNYGDERIFNLDYFLDTKYMPQELIDKLSAWKQWRDDNRETFTNYSKTIAEYNERISELTYRVPSDADYWKQWDGLREDELQKSLELYTAELNALRVSVDDDPQYTEDGVYIPWKNSNDEIDDEAYLQALHNLANGYGGYYTYYEIITYVIPNINIAIENLNLPADQKADYIDVEGSAAKWELYGKEELEAELKNYTNQMTALAEYATPWDDLTEEQQAEHPGGASAYNVQHKQYEAAENAVGDEETPNTIKYQLKIVNDEIHDINASLTVEQNSRKQMVEDATLESWVGEDSEGNEISFTSDEITLIYTLFHDTDYSNENILTTSLDTTQTTVDVQMELFNDATDKLVEYSQPQYNFSIDLDNLLRLEEFADWEADFVNGNYIRVGIRDDYAVKLRIVSMSWNPCDTQPDLSLGFSNMITGASGRDDLTYLIGSSNGAGKNSISSGTGGANTSEEYVTNLLQLMAKTQLFKNYVNGAVTSNSVISDNTAQIASIVGDYLEYAEIHGGSADIDAGTFRTLYSNYIGADLIVSKLINSDEAYIKDANIQNLNADKITSGTIDTDLLNANDVITKLLTADSAKIGDLQAGVVTADAVGATLGNFSQANIDSLFANTAFANKFSALSASVATQTIDNAYITNVVADNISVADLKAGDITISDAMRILSENGQLVMNGSAMQFKDKDGNVGVQIGYATNSKPSIIIRDNSGNLLIDSTGVHADAIANELIVNDMVKQGTITTDRLAFNVETDQNGNVVTHIDNIYMGDGGKFGVEYTSFKQQVSLNTQSLSNLSSMVDGIEIVGDQVFTIDQSNNISPNSITLTAITKNNATVSHWYIDNIENTTYVSQDGKSITIPSSFMFSKQSAQIKATNSDGSLYDIFTIYTVKDGTNGSPGAPGTSPYYIKLTYSEGTSFNESRLPSSTIGTCTVYSGTTEVTPTSYKWMSSLDGGDTWTQIGNQKNIEIPLSVNNVYRQVYCEVTI